MYIMQYAVFTCLQYAVFTCLWSAGGPDRDTYTIYTIYTIYSLPSYAVQCMQLHKSGIPMTMPSVSTIDDDDTNINKHIYFSPSSLS